jgi:hypothetical protein
VLESLHDYAGWFGEATPNGVRVSPTCMLEMVIDTPAGRPPEPTELIEAS